MLPAIPQDPSSIDLAWLGASLGDQVESIRVEPITDRRGMNGETFRLHLEGEGIPASVVAKFPGIGSRGVARYQRWYEREVRFYQELAAETPLRAPRCHAAAIDNEDDFILVLEDLGGLPQGDQVRGCDPAEATRVVRSMAQMHARWWGQTGGIDWLPYTTVGLDRAGPVQSAFAHAWDRVAPVVPREAHRAITAAVAAYPRLLEEIATPPVTLCHGDLRLDNLFLPPAGADVIAFDWQFACQARGAYDLAYFLALDLAPDTLAAHEDELLSVYLHAIEEGGVSGYMEAMLRRDYAVSLLLGTAVFAIGAGTPQPSEASRVMHEVGLQRLGHAVGRIWADRHNDIPAS